MINFLVLRESLSQVDSHGHQIFQKDIKILITKTNEEINSGLDELESLERFLIYSNFY